MDDNKNITDPEFDEEQKNEVENINTPKEFSADLAARVADDAKKLILGGISESEFHQKYHDEYVKEFGIDDRLVTDSTFAKQLSRRTLLKIGGVTLAGLVGSLLVGRKAVATGGAVENKFAGLLLSEEEENEQGTRVQMGMVIDLENCDGCMECIYACSNHNVNPQGVYWLYVLAYQDENKEGANFLVRPCQHCANPPCVKVCPVRARHKREKDGLVLTDYNLCIGCRYCMVTCPYGVNYFQWDEPVKDDYYHGTLLDGRGRWVIGNPPKGVMGKCTFCPDRQDDGRKNVVCQLACPHDVFHFGDMNDPDSEPNRYLAQKAEEKGGNISTFRLLEDHGTKPSIVYIGHEPSRAAKPIDGPVTYADWGLVEKRLPLLGGYKPWFMKIFGGS